MYLFALFTRLHLLMLYGGLSLLFVSASRTPRSGSPSLSLPTLSATAASIQAYQKPYNQTNTTTLKHSYPAKSSGNPGKVCFIEDCANYPNATKTVDQYGGDNHATPDADLSKLCVLWNSSCIGDMIFARNKFFANNTAETLISNECFLNQPTDPSEANNLEGCYKIESSEMLQQFGQAKKWMRSPQCLSDAAIWSSSVPDLEGISTLFPHVDPGAGSCCAKCDISVQDVDIYYWPEVDMDTTCLKTIGNTTESLNYGATTTTLSYDLIGRSSSTVMYSTYWGCMGQDSSITTTAYLTQINSITFKASSYNPWLPPLCSEKTLPPIALDASMAAHDTYASILPRAHSLIIKPSATHNKGSPVSTLVLENYTL